MDETIKLLQIEGWELSWNKERARAHCVPGQVYDHQHTLWHSLGIEKDRILSAFRQKKQGSKGKFLPASTRWGVKTRSIDLISDLLIKDASLAESWEEEGTGTIPSLRKKRIQKNCYSFNKRTSLGERIHCRFWYFL